MKRRPFPDAGLLLPAFSSVHGAEPWDLHTNGHILVAQRVDAPSFEACGPIAETFAGYLAEEADNADEIVTPHFALWASIGEPEAVRNLGFLYDVPIDLGFVALAFDDAEPQDLDIRIARFAQGTGLRFGGAGWRAWVIGINPTSLGADSDHWPRILSKPRAKTFCAQCSLGGRGDRAPYPCSVHEPMFEAIRSRGAAS